MTSIPWPQRPLLFALLGGFSAIAFFCLVYDTRQEDAYFSLRIASASAIVVFSLAFAIVTRRDKLISGVLFAVICAAVIGGISFWRLHINWPDLFNFLALAVALFVFSPFYQTSLHSDWRNYRSLHYHAWSNAVIVPLGLMFVGLAFAMAYLLSALFSLVGIDLFKELLMRDAAPYLVTGVALGASIAVLREHETIIVSTQRIVQSVASILTVPLALGLAGFLLVLPFTGLESLWNSTRNTSATLFTCALAALVFINSVVREDAENQSNGVFMQGAARALSLCCAPLAVIAALAIKLRVDQYGWTPDRLWATVICCLLVVYGALYLIAVLRKQQFNAAVRQANLYLSMLVCAMAVFLATPLLDFGAYSVKDQVARLKDGRISEAKFDLVALAFDFGPAGREALLNLKDMASAEFAKRIDQVVAADNRYGATNFGRNRASDIAAKITVVSGSETIPEKLLNKISADGACLDANCYLLWLEELTRVFIVEQECVSSNGECRPIVRYYRLEGDWWLSNPWEFDLMISAMSASGESQALDGFSDLDQAALEGKIEVRPVQRMQLFIDGKPVGPAVQ